MRTLLINTPYPPSEPPLIPMGLAYIAALLAREGIEVEIQDFLVTKYTREKLHRKLVEYSPQIVGATAVTMSYPAASRILRDCKETDENIITVIGGPHVSFTPHETLNESPWIDVVVIGEGEYTMLEIASGKRLKEVNGIAFRDNGSVALTPPRRLIEDLDELPFPARHFFPLARYQALGNTCQMITSRGCPFGCIFCVGHRMVGRKGRFRHPKRIVDEIEEILGQGFQTINIVDDLLTLNHKHVYSMCDEITSRKLKFEWTAFSRVDTINRELLARMKETGCSYFCYGIESGNQQILDAVKKKITLEKARQGVKLAKEAGIEAFASFIIGLPGETRETLRQTVNFARELDTPYGFHLLAPFPGTELRDKAKEYGINILTNDWSKYNANEPIVETEGATAQMLIDVDREFDEGLTRHFQHLEELEMKGKLDESTLREAKRRRRRAIATDLLQEDIIENLGKIRTTTDPVEGLATELSGKVSYPIPHIRDAIRELVNEGLLKYDNAGGFATWGWG